MIKYLKLIVFQFLITGSITAQNVTDVSFTTNEGEPFTLFGLLNEGKILEFQYTGSG